MHNFDSQPADYRVDLPILNGELVRLTPGEQYGIPYTPPTHPEPSAPAYPRPESIAEEYIKADRAPIGQWVVSSAVQTEQHDPMVLDDDGSGIYRRESTGNSISREVAAAGSEYGWRAFSPAGRAHDSIAETAKNGLGPPERMLLQRMREAQDYAEQHGMEAAIRQFGSLGVAANHPLRFTEDGKPRTTSEQNELRRYERIVAKNKRHIQRQDAALGIGKALRLSPQWSNVDVARR